MLENNGENNGMVACKNLAKLGIAATLPFYLSLQFFSTYLKKNPENRIMVQNFLEEKMPKETFSTVLQFLQK